MISFARDLLFRDVVPEWPEIKLKRPACENIKKPPQVCTQAVFLKMVELDGIEPTTSTMPL
jgi:hypothetical protein